MASSDNPAAPAGDTNAAVRAVRARVLAEPRRGPARVQRRVDRRRQRRDPRRVVRPLHHQIVRETQLRPRSGTLSQLNKQCQVGVGSRPVSDSGRDRRQGGQRDQLAGAERPALSGRRAPIDPHAARAGRRAAKEARGPRCAAHRSAAARVQHGLVHSHARRLPRVRDEGLEPAHRGVHAAREHARRREDLQVVPAHCRAPNAPAAAGHQIDAAVVDARGDRHPSRREQLAQSAGVAAPLRPGEPRSDRPRQEPRAQQPRGETDEGRNLVCCAARASPHRVFSQNAVYVCSGLVASELHFRHYALSVPFYTHFTSPIRRYPDILVHRLLDAALEQDGLDHWKQEIVKKYREKGPS